MYERYPDVDVKVPATTLRIQIRMLVCSGNRKLFAKNITTVLETTPDGIESHEPFLLFINRLMPRAVENSAKDFMKAERGAPLIETERNSAKEAKKAELIPKSEVAIPIGNPLRSNFNVG
jgi:hypothetical protein